MFLGNEAQQKNAAGYPSPSKLKFPVGTFFPGEDCLTGFSVGREPLFPGEHRFTGNSVSREPLFPGDHLLTGFSVGRGALFPGDHRESKLGSGPQNFRHNNGHAHFL